MNTYVIRAYRKLIVDDVVFLRRIELQLQGFRFCRSRSARKHRKQGHHVRFIGEGVYAWRDERATGGV